MDRSSDIVPDMVLVISFSGAQTYAQVDTGGAGITAGRPELHSNVQSLRTAHVLISRWRLLSMSARWQRKLKSGDELHPDIIVTATGLKLRIGAGIDIDIDGEPFHIDQHYVWKGIMFEGMPNCAFSFGYFDAAWTLGVDMSAQLACRILKQMRRDGADAVVAERSQRDKEQMNDIKFMPLSSTYVQKALSSLPKLGDRAPWRPRSTYLWELFAVRWGDIRTGLRWMTL